METGVSEGSQIVSRAPSVDITKPISNWFKPCDEKIQLSKTKAAVKSESDHHEWKCKSIIGCTAAVLKGFEYCNKHILEDKTSPFRRCSYISKSDYKRCRNPTPISTFKRSYCKLHDKEMCHGSNVKTNKNKGKKKHSGESTEKVIKKRPSTLPVSSLPNDTKDSKGSSSEEEFSFFTDTVQVNKTECLWLGNQASDADSTDSEDECVLNHAGVWTLEESVRILKEKMTRIRHLYTLQFKRLNHCLKEERAKMLKDYDMDPFALSKVGFDGCRDSSFEAFVEDVHLSNYQKMDGAELIAEKSREKRIKGVSLYAKKNDLPRCLLHLDGHRCSSKALPLSKFCFNHICSDPEQLLFSSCAFKYPNGKSCGERANAFSSSCYLHDSLLKKCHEKSFDLFQSAKHRRESRKRKMEKEKAIAKRSSARLKEVSSSISCSPVSGNSKTNSNLNTHSKEEQILKDKAVENFDEITLNSGNKNVANDKQKYSLAAEEGKPVDLAMLQNRESVASSEDGKDFQLAVTRTATSTTNSMPLSSVENVDQTNAECKSDSLVKL